MSRSLVHVLYGTVYTGTFIIAKEGKNSGPDEPSGLKSIPVYTGSEFHRFHCISNLYTCSIMHFPVHIIVLRFSSLVAWFFEVTPRLHRSIKPFFQRPALKGHYFDRFIIMVVYDGADLKLP